MKYFIVFCSFFFLYFNYSEAQTNANVAGPENVLVVYKTPNNPADTVSRAVKDYYVNTRGIPAINICKLDALIPHDINVDGSTHSIILAEGNNIIRDSYNHSIGTWYATEHAWKYFYQYVAEPIKNYISLNNLNSTIKYIVLCKGVPFKIQAGADSGSVICNLSVDGLLCMLNSNNYEDLLHSIYTRYRSYAVNNYSIQDYRNQMQIQNPYYYSDLYLNINHRFTPGVFTKPWNGYTIKLDYLISHLDGINYEMVKDMIDRSSQAIHADNYDWFIDADPTPCHGGSIMVGFANSTATKLNSLGFSNYSFDVSEDTVTYHNKPVISYSSNGVHTTKAPNNNEGQTLHPDYIQSQLNFNYVPGAIFNTAESFNAHLLSSISRRPGAEMGQVVEFFLMGGTVSVGHAYEPLTYGIVKDYILFPDYQAGYSFIDAAYMGMQYLAWQNVVVGDPLTTIAWGTQTLTANTTWSSTNLVTGQITVPSGKTLTIASNAVINFKYNGSLLVNGTLNIESGAELNFTNSASLTVNGTLSAQSTLPNKITFDFSSPNYSTQNGIKVNLNGTVSISNSIIKNAYNGLKIVPNGNQSTIENSTIQNCYNGMDVEYGSKDANLTINGNTINNNSNSGIYINNPGYGTNVEPVISNNTITGNTSSMGIYLNNTMLTVSNNTISSCDYGIYAFDDNSTYNSNIIHDNIDEGIFLSGGMPYLFNNQIYHNVDAEGIGVYASSSSPQFGYHTHSGMGNNVISNNSVGIKAENYSHPFLGTYDNANEYSLGGYNSIYTDGGGLVTSAYHSQVDAEYTYWGPNPHNFYQDGTSSIDTNNALSSDPNSTINPNIISTAFASAVQTSTSANIVQSNADILTSSNISPISGAQPIFTKSFDSTAKTWSKQHLLLFAGSTLRSQRHYKDAAKIYKKIISINPGKKWAVFALKNLQEIYSESKRDTVPNEILLGNDLINYCKGITDSSSNESLKTLSYLILGEESVYEGKIKNAIEYYNSLNKLNTSESKLLSTWHLFNIYRSIYKDSVLEEKSVEYMKSNFPDNHLTQLAANLLKPGSKIINSKKSSAKMSIAATKEKESIPLKYNLSQNYPNPFNPSTTIQYTLKAPSYLSLKVYNALGQEVAVLADGIQNEGYHSVVFTGDHLSSGVYLYRLFVKSNGGAVMFNSVKKMLYLK